MVLATGMGYVRWAVWRYLFLAGVKRTDVRMCGIEDFSSGSDYVVYERFLN